MKSLLASLLLFTGSLCAGEIQFSHETWNDLSIPLGIAPIYLQINSPLKARYVGIEMDLYVKGEFKRTISAGSLSREQRPLGNLKVALYFQPKDDDSIKATFVTNWDGMEVISGAPFSSRELPVKEGYSSLGDSEARLDSATRVPIFTLIAGGGERGFKSATPITDTPKANPNSSVIIGYLKHE